MAAASAAGLTFAGRPPTHPDPVDNQIAVRGTLVHAKFVLAFSNLVRRAEYTHLARDYLTERWTKAFGAGATVVGTPPAAAAHTVRGGRDDLDRPRGPRGRDTPGAAP